MLRTIKQRAILMAFGTFVVLACGVILARGFVKDTLEKK